MFTSYLISLSEQILHLYMHTAIPETILTIRVKFILHNTLVFLYKFIRIGNYPEKNTILYNKNPEQCSVAQVQNNYVDLIKVTLYSALRI